MKKTILIVDDNEISLRYLIFNVGTENINVFSATNGQEAVEFCEKYKDKIDLILMDIQMPILDGFQAAKLIKQIRPNVLIIVQSGYDDYSKLGNTQHYFDDSIPKPIDKALLKQKVNYYLNM